jgi:hypothetical protein
VVEVGEVGSYTLVCTQTCFEVELGCDNCTFSLGATPYTNVCVSVPSSFYVLFIVRAQTHLRGPPSAPAEIWILKISISGNIREETGVCQNDILPAIMFFVGKSNQESVNKDLEEEAEHFQDICIMDFADNYGCGFSSTSSNNKFLCVFFVFSFAIHHFSLLCSFLMKVDGPASFPNEIEPNFYSTKKLLSESYLRPWKLQGIT